MENPWGEPSPPLASAAAPSSPTDRRDSSESQASKIVDDDAKGTPRLSLELVDDRDEDAPAWDAHDDSPDGLDDADDAWANEARASMLKVNDLTISEQEEAGGEQARDAAGLATTDDQQEETTQVAEPPAAPAPPIPVVPSALPDVDIDAGQQMDDFPEDDDNAEMKDEGDDDFDDFGDTAGGGGHEDDDDEFGDFGDFGDAAPLDEAAFEATTTTTTTPLPSTSLASASSPFTSPQPFASTSAAAATLLYPPLHFDLSGDPTRQSISSQLHDFWQGAFPAAANAVSDEPERQVEGVAQVLVSESSCVWGSRSLFFPDQAEGLCGRAN